LGLRLQDPPKVGLGPVGTRPPEGSLGPMGTRPPEGSLGPMGTRPPEGSLGPMGTRPPEGVLSHGVVQATTPFSHHIRKGNPTLPHYRKGNPTLPHYRKANGLFLKNSDGICQWRATFRCRSRPCHCGRWVLSISKRVDLEYHLGITTRT
jgi:hypothetical protein